jgi:hypothetical protein
MVLSLEAPEASVAHDQRQRVRLPGLWRPVGGSWVRIRRKCWR